MFKIRRNRLLIYLALVLGLAAFNTNMRRGYESEAQAACISITPASGDAVYKCPIQYVCRFKAGGWAVFCNSDVLMLSSGGTGCTHVGYLLPL